MASFFFSETPVRNFAEAKATRSDLFVRWFHEMLDRGICLAPSPYEALFVSAAHSDRDTDDTVSAAREAFGLPEDDLDEAFRETVRACPD